MISQNQSCFNKLSKVSCLQNISHKLQLFPNNESELSQTIDSIISLGSTQILRQRAI